MNRIIKKPISDYHMHTPLCGHAKGEPILYAQKAIQIGLEEIGFSDHAPLFSHRDPGISMDHHELPLYHQMIETIQKDMANQLTIRIGIESDYVPGHDNQVKNMLAAYPYDYVIGSVHFIKDWGFDNPIQLLEWDKKDVNKVYLDYFKLLTEAAMTGLFDIIGHVDLVKKFGFHPTIDLSDEVEKMAKAFKKNDMVVELNTSGLRRPIKEIYPSLNYLKIFKSYNIPITLGSDAHKPDDVGCDLDKAMEWAIQAGYTEYVLFKNRKINRSISLL